MSLRLEALKVHYQFRKKQLRDSTQTMVSMPALTEHRQFLRQTFDKTEISSSELVPEVQNESSTDLLPEFGSLSLSNPREPTTSTANPLILPTDVSPSLPVAAANLDGVWEVVHENPQQPTRLEGSLQQKRKGTFTNKWKKVGKRCIFIHSIYLFYESFFYSQVDFILVDGNLMEKLSLEVEMGSLVKFTIFFYFIGSIYRFIESR